MSDRLPGFGQTYLCLDINGNPTEYEDKVRVVSHMKHDGHWYVVYRYVLNDEADPPKGALVDLYVDDLDSFWKHNREVA